MPKQYIKVDIWNLKGDGDARNFHDKKATIFELDDTQTHRLDDSWQLHTQIQHKFITWIKMNKE